MTRVAGNSQLPTSISQRAWELGFGRWVLSVVAIVLSLWPGPRVSGQEPAVRMVADEGEGARYWPRWRGPSGQGVVTGTGYVDTWSATQNVAWKTPVPGRGNSSPIVWGDRVFLTTAYEGGRRVSLLAYRRADGRLLWETPAPAGRTDSGAHYKNGHASATPATDGERVYVSFGPRGLFAFDFTGKIVWQQGPRRDGGYHGAAGSPLLYRDRISCIRINTADPSLPRSTRARAATFGGRRATPATDGGPPIAVRVGTRDEIIVSSQQQVQAYDPIAARSCGGAAATPMK